MLFKRIPYVVITCPGHSGSTLLAMCLNAHPEISVFGEFSSLPKRVARIDAGIRKGLCSHHNGDCELLNESEVKRIKAMYGGGVARVGYLRRLFGHMTYANHFKNITKSTMIGDSSKDVSWAKTLWKVWRWGFDLKFIALIRDGRGVVASHYRQGRDIETYAKMWTDEAHKLSQLIEIIPSKRIVCIRYEDLAINPESVLRKISGFLGIEFHPQMLRYEEVDHHIVGGNSGARVAVRVASGEKVDAVSSNVDFYLKKKSRFFLDERWKNELSSEQIATINGTAGEALKKFHYPI